MRVGYVEGNTREGVWGGAEDRQRGEREDVGYGPWRALRLPLQWSQRYDDTSSPHVRTPANPLEVYREHWRCEVSLTPTEHAVPERSQAAAPDASGACAPRRSRRHCWTRNCTRNSPPCTPLSRRAGEDRRRRSGCGDCRGCAGGRMDAVQEEGGGHPAPSVRGPSSRPRPFPNSICNRQ